MAETYGKTNKRLIRHIKTYKDGIKQAEKDMKSGHPKAVEYGKKAKALYEKELSRLLKPETEASYDQEDVDVKERKAKEKAENKKNKATPKPAPAATTKPSGQRGRPPKPANEKQVKNPSTPAADSGRPTTAKEEKAPGISQSGDVTNISGPMISEGREEKSRPTTNTPGKDTPVAKKKDEKKPSAKKDEKKPNKGSKTPPPAVAAAANKAKDSVDSKGTKKKPRNFGANKKGDGGYWERERAQSAERVKAAKEKQGKFGANTKGDGGFWDDERARTKEMVESNNDTEQRHNEWQKVLKGDDVTHTTPPSGGGKGKTMVNVDDFGDKNKEAKKQDIESVDPAAPAPSAPADGGAAAPSGKKPSLWSRIRGRGRGGAAGGGGGTPPTPPAGGGAGAPPTPPAGGGGAPAGGGDPSSGAPAGGGRSAGFQSGHQMFNNAGQVNFAGANISGSVSGITGGSPFSTHNQNVVSYGGSGVTATTSGKAKGAGAGTTASTSGSAASSHPRAKNAGRGSRPTKK